MSVTRYEVKWLGDAIVVDPAGRFVQYSDYQRQEDRVKELEAQLSKPKTWSPA